MKLLRLFVSLSILAVHPCLPSYALAADDPTPDITKGFQFTTGIGALYIRKGDITEAIADNGTVRVKSSETTKLGLWFTANSFSTLWKGAGVVAGPFLGAQLGGEDNRLVQSFAIGIGIAAAETKAGSSPLVFNIGWGITSRHSLRSPYVDGSALPSGSSQPLLTSSTASGPLILVTYRFGGTSSP